MERKFDPEEWVRMRKRTVIERTKKRLKKLEGKYGNLEKKLDSEFYSDMEQVLVNKGYYVSVNPMLFRPYALLRYIIGKASDLNYNTNTKVLDLITRRIVKCGSVYELPTAKLNAGLKVLFRHIKYGSSELDDVYCLDEWVRYLKNYKDKPEGKVYWVPSDIKLLEDNPEFNRYFNRLVLEAGTSGYVEENLDAIFNRVSRNIAKCTFDIINLGRVKEPEYIFDLNEILLGLLNGYTPVNGISQVLYVELFKFIRISRFDSFEEFESEGIRKFFSEWLDKYDKVADEIIKEDNIRRKIRTEKYEKLQAANLSGEREEDKEGVNEFVGQQRGQLQQTSMFNSSKPESDESNRFNDESIAIREEKSGYWENIMEEKEKSGYKENIPSRPIRDTISEENNIMKQIKLKLRSAEEIGKTISAMEIEIEKLDNSLQAKKSVLKSLIEQENILWDGIEELRSKQK